MRTINIFFFCCFIIVLIFGIVIDIKTKNELSNLHFDNSKIVKDTTITKHTKDFSDSFILALAKIESNNNPKVHNKKTDAAGLLQITPIYVKEINKYSKIQYSLEDRFDSIKSIEMFKCFNQIHNPSFDIERAIFLHNPKAGNKYRLAILNKIKI